MVLYIIGIGLGDEKDITVNGLETLRRCSRVYLESYTSTMGVKRKVLEEFYGCRLIEADREFVELGVHEVLEYAKVESVAFLVVGDPLCATTHIDLITRAKKFEIPVEIIHNTSIVNAIGSVGLQIYNYGQIVSIPFWEESWKPISFYEKILKNLHMGLHTLCLLDIKIKEQSTENLLKNNKVYEPPRFMTIGDCIRQIMEVEKNIDSQILASDMPCIGAARIGHKDQKIAFGTMEQLKNVDFGNPLHCLVICGSLHELELEYLNYHSISPTHTAEK